MKLRIRNLQLTTENYKPVVYGQLVDDDKPKGDKIIMVGNVVAIMETCHERDWAKFLPPMELIDQS